MDQDKYIINLKKEKSRCLSMVKSLMVKEGMFLL